ncbi:MAG: YheC/YheD family protein, partial [Nanoarchaeota archaeon]
MKIGILRHEILGYAENELLRIGWERGHQVEVINPYAAQLSVGIRPEVDILISRAEIETFGDSVMDAYFRVLDFYGAWSIPIINGKQATLNAQDKFRTHALVAMTGVHTPRTVINYGAQAIRDSFIEGRWNLPYVIKKPYGGRGKGVFFVRCKDDLEEIANFFSECEPLIVQEYIPLEKNKQGDFVDMRLWACRNATTEKPECLGGFYRNSANGNFLTNLCAGGRISKMSTVPDGVSDMVEKSLEAITADVAGIDVA